MIEQNQEKVNVLLVDDRPEILMAMVALLRAPTLNLVCVESGREALETLQGEEFALILLDVGMPEMDGFETARQIRKRQHLCHLPIIFVTAGIDHRGFVFEGYATGAIDVVFKPFEPVILVSKVNAFVDLYKHERRLKRAIQSQLETKDKFFRTVSHELRTPLNALTRFLEIVESGLAGELNDEQKEYLGISLRNAHNLKELISDLLDVVRTQNDKMTMLPRCVALSEILDELVPVLNANAKAKEINITLNLADDIPFAWADPSRIRQVILNLAGNAMKFGPREMPLEIRVRLSEKDPDMLQIDVVDQGPGIRAEKTAAIFEPLHQDETNAAEASRQGLGLGLYICKELVLQHGGRIWVESGAGQGSTFSFTLPCFEPNRCLPERIQRNGRFGDGTALLEFAVATNGRAPNRSQCEEWHRSYCEVLEKCAGGGASDVILPGSLHKKRGREVVSLILTNCGESERSALIQRCRKEFEACRKLKVPNISSADISGKELSSFFVPSRSASNSQPDEGIYN